VTSVSSVLAVLLTRMPTLFAVFTGASNAMPWIPPSDASHRMPTSSWWKRIFDGSSLNMPYPRITNRFRCSPGVSYSWSPTTRVDVTLYSPGGKTTILFSCDRAALIAAWMAAVSSASPSPTAPNCWGVRTGEPSALTRLGGADSACAEPPSASPPTPTTPAPAAERSIMRRFNRSVTCPSPYGGPTGE
jgi:hypothetical protein